MKLQILRMGFKTTSQERIVRLVSDPSGKFYVAKSEDILSDFLEGDIYSIMKWTGFKPLDC